MEQVLYSQSYDKKSQEEQDEFISFCIDKIKCDGCGLVIHGAMRIVPKNRNLLQRTIFLHYFPLKDEQCKIRFCSNPSCGANVNTITRECNICKNVIPDSMERCSQCSFNDITITSKCNKCNNDNRQNIRENVK